MGIWLTDLLNASEMKWLWSSDLKAPDIKDKLRLINHDYRSHEVAASGVADEGLDFLFCLKPQDSESEPLLFKDRQISPSRF